MKQRLPLTIAITMLVVGACGGGSLKRDADGAVTSKGKVSAYEVRVGDCSAAELKEETVDIELLPCSEPHTHEAYFVVEHPDGPYPGSTAIETFAEQQCVGSFSDYVGIELSESRFFFTYLYPSVSTWNDDKDRQIVCFVVSRDEPIVGSVKGLAQ